MKLYLGLLLAFICAGGVRAQTAVLYVGSDWCDAAVPLQTLWSAPRFAEAAGVPCVTVDEPEVVTDAVRAVWEQQRAIRFEMDRTPAMAYFDAKGRCVLLREGLPATTNREALLALIAEGKARAVKIDALLAKNSAEAAGQVLALMIPELGMGRSQEARGMKAAWEISKAKDPQDAEGWRGALTFDPAADACYKVQAFAKDKAFDKGAAWIAACVSPAAKAKLSVNQQQGLKLLTFVLYRNVAEKKAANIALLKRVVAMDPTTHFGSGAQGMLWMLGEGKAPVRIEPPAPPARQVKMPADRPWESVPTDEGAAVCAKARLEISTITFEKMMKRRGGAEFLRSFFADREWMEDFFGSGPAKGSWERSLLTLEALAAAQPLTDRAMKKWATAAALNVGDGSEAQMVQLLQSLVTIRTEKLLLRGADEQPVAWMRYVLTPKQLEPEAMLWIAHQHHVPPRKYGGVCWFAPYRLENFFGDSIHGSNYYRPWGHVYLRQEATRKVGGVCGSLSYYGSIAGKAHGLPSTPGGQPGHCAYSLWSAQEGRWTIAYYVAAYTGAHFNLWDSRFSWQDLAADDFFSPTHRASMRALWEAEVARAKENPQPVRSLMTCDAYAWEGRTLPTDWTKPALLRVDTNLDTFDLDQGGRADHVVLAWKGELTLTAAAMVQFDLTSDDGSKLFLRGKLMIDNDGAHGMILKTKQLRLSAGRHPFEVQYFNLSGGRGFEFSVHTIERYDEPLAQGFVRATALQPTNYDAWIAYNRYLAACEDTPVSAWKTFGLACAKALNAAPEPAWDLLEKDFLPAIEKAEGKDGVQTQLELLHAEIRQSAFNSAEFCNYEEILNRHAKLLGDDPVRLFRLLKVELASEYGSRNAFGTVMRWGGSRFLKEEAKAKQFVALINDLLKQKGNKDNALGAFISEAIREASAVGNRAAFQSLCDLQETLASEKRSIKDIGGFTTLPLLSDKGLLKLSTTSNWDQPASYRRVIDGKTAIGNFHTAQEEAPWAEVELPGMAEIGAVLLENIHTQNNRRAVPFIVEISEDGKRWQKVASADRVQEEWRLTFPAVKGQFVRVTRKGEGTTFLHFRKLMVFGKKLY
ncbi:MAG: PA14 domain-containing protein [Kiritimatiellia bacterium]